MPDAPRIPIKLASPPIIGAVAEIRFSGLPTIDLPALLPGILFSQISGLSIASEGQSNAVPLEVRKQIEAFQFAPVMQLAGDGYTIGVADRGVTVFGVGPYVGWSAFKALVLRVFNVANDSKLLGKLERTSVKYTNLIPSSLGTDHLAMTNLDLTLGSRKFMVEPTTIISEVQDNGVIVILKVVTQATATQPAKDALTGLAVEIDAIWSGEFAKGFDSLPEALEKVHEVEKRYFYSVMKDEIIAKFGPQYE